MFSLLCGTVEIRVSFKFWYKCMHFQIYALGYILKTIMVFSNVCRRKIIVHLENDRRAKFRRLYTNYLKTMIVLLKCTNEMGERGIVLTVPGS